MNLLKEIFKGDSVVWVIFACLCTISIIVVFSASSTLTYETGNHLGPILAHTRKLMLGAGLVVVFHHLPYKYFKIIPCFILLPSVFLLILLLCFKELNIAGILVIEKINDAGRWVKLFGVQFQPSELTKMGVVVVMATLLSKGRTEDGPSSKAFKNILLFCALPCCLIAPENYSTAALLFSTVYLMMLVGGVDLKKTLLLGGALAALVALFLTFLFLTPNPTLKRIPMGHRLTVVKGRIIKFVNPPQVPAAKFDIDGDGQIAHARIALATSHVIGKGPGNSVQRDFLSQAFSDFIFAIILEEFGLLGGVVVMSLYFWLLVRIYRIASNCDKPFPAFLVLGIGILLVAQALFNMMVAVGLAPVTGQPLPLISRGGTSNVINCMYFAMILSVSKYVEKLKAERKAAELAKEEAKAAAKAERRKQLVGAVHEAIGMTDPNEENAGTGQ